MNLKETELKRSYRLKDFTTIKIGGEAKNFFIANSVESLQEIIKNSQHPYYILGGGSNLLVKDDILDKPVIKLGGGFDYIRMNDKYVEIGAATLLSVVIKYALANNLAGFDNLVGIPASIGGLVMMNASSFGSEISAYLYEVEAMDKHGFVRRLKKEEIIFSYRASSLNEYIILRIWFKVVKDYNTKSKISNYIKKRILTQDFEFPNCGCIFKNPETESAGFLIDACGLKGFRKNDAQVSNKHANFIINLNNASYNDVDYLIKHIKENVHKKFGIILEEEIKRWS